MGVPKPTERPAEFGGVAGALALLIARALGVDDVTTVTAIAIVIGFLPALITWIVVLVNAQRNPDAA